MWLFLPAGVAEGFTDDIEEHFGRDSATDERTVADYEQVKKSKASSN